VAEGTADVRASGSTEVPGVVLGADAKGRDWRPQTPGFRAGVGGKRWEDHLRLGSSSCWLAKLDVVDGRQCSETATGATVVYE
jgi:hypothetical protein